MIFEYPDDCNIVSRRDNEYKFALILLVDSDKLNLFPPITFTC